MKLIRPTAIADTGAFTRASAATYFDAAGVLRTASVNTPRYGYEQNTGRYLGLIVESAATNLLTKSEQVDTADGWAKGSNITRVGKAAAPDGALTATTYSTSVGGDAHVSQTVSFAANTTYTVSLFARLRSGSVPTAGALIIVDYDNNNIAGAERAVCGWDGLSSTWKRFTLTIQNVAAITSSLFLCADFANGAQIDIWGAQLETGSSASSYISTAATPATRAADVITGAGLIASSIAETDAPVWASGTTYALDAEVIKSHRIWRSLQAGNTNHDPAASPTWWLDTGPTNRWGMFDSVVGTASTATDTFTVTLAPGRCDALALLEVIAESVTITMTAGVETVFSRTIDLIDNSVVTDWYSYFFEPVVRANYLVITDLPVYGEGVITITLNGTGAVSCGMCVVGMQYSLGGLLRSPSIGINDFSKKSTNDFGRTILVQRDWSKRLSARLILDSANVDRVVRVLAGLRATPVVWIGSEYFDALVVYGFYKDFDVDIAYTTLSYCTLNLEGMI